MVAIHLLVSAGSFVYVATMHILPEIMHKISDKDLITKIVGLVMLWIGMVSPIALTYIEDD